jgi:cell division transport system permease protein
MFFDTLASMVSFSDSMGSISHAFTRAVRQITRDRTWGMTLVLLSCVMLLVQMLFTFLLGVRGVGNILTERSAIQLEVLPSAREQDIQELNALLNEHPSVRSVEFLSKEQVYERQKELHPDDIAFLEQYDFDNPFPDIFSVTLKSLDAYDALAGTLQSDRWRSVVDPSFLATSADHEQEVRSLLQVTDGLYTLSIIFMVIAFIVLCSAVFEWTVRTAARRGHELHLSHMLGARPLAVLLPLSCEMTLLLVSAAVIGTLAMIVLLFLIPLFMPAFALETPFALLQSELLPLLSVALPVFLLIEILMMPLLSLAGVAAGVRGTMPRSFSLFS